jgi:hypothetical protein
MESREQRHNPYKKIKRKHKELIRRRRHNIVKEAMP